MTLRTITLAGASALALIAAACSGPSGETDQTPATTDKATPAEVAPEPAEPAAEPESAAVMDEARAGALQLIKLDCGSIYVADLDIFSTEGDYAGQTDTLANTCWLVRHPEGNLLWDLGLPGALAGQDEQTQGVFTVSLEETITDQLAAMNLAMSDIDMVSISHSHFDHVGQAGQIDPETTAWLVNQTEYDFMFPPEPESDAARADAGVDYSGFEGLNREIIADEHDVFGDGSVRIFMTPGHTPGHASLYVDLPETGPVLLTGDLYHRAESRELGRVPQFNTDVQETKASITSFENRAEELGAQVIIQHEPADTESLPEVMR